MKQVLTSTIKERTLSQGRYSAKNQKRLKAIASAAQGKWMLLWKFMNLTTIMKGEDIEEDFGVEEKDWDVYLIMARDELTEEEERDQKALLELDERIELLEKREGIKERAKRLSELYTMDIGVERIRVAEVIFQPSLAGSQALASVINLVQQVLSKFDQEQQLKLCKNIVIAGGNTMSPHFKERFEIELRKIRPYESEINVYNAGENGSWKGGSMLGRGSYLSQCSVTKQMYDENGHEYLKKHALSNTFTVDDL